MDARRKRFYAALGLFMVWVACLSAMVIFASREPPQAPRAAAAAP